MFTVAGGLTAVIWTDFVQTVLMIAGALALSAIGEAVPTSNSRKKYKATQNFCLIPPPVLIAVVQVQAIPL